MTELLKLYYSSGNWTLRSVSTENDLVTVEHDGTLVLKNDAVVWEDLRVPVTSTKLGGTKDPGFAVFKDNGSGSQGVFINWFDKTTEEELYFAVQVPHCYKLGSDIEPHVHWTPAANGGAGAVVSWGLEYTWAEIGSSFGNTSIIYSNTHYPGDGSLVAGKHYLTDFATISGDGINSVSSMLCCRVFRDAGGTGATDDYDDDAGLIEIDFHFQIDTLGSRQELAK
jgi:hypothetical protein